MLGAGTLARGPDGGLAQVLQSADGSAARRAWASVSVPVGGCPWSNGGSDGTGFVPRRPSAVQTDAVPQVDLEEVCRRLADRSGTRTEADVQADVRTLLLYGGLNLHDAQVRLEAPVDGRRRIDVEVGAAVIEVKKDLRIGNVADDAVRQLTGYVKARSRALGQRYVGVLTDGVEWQLFHLSADEILQPVTKLLVDPVAPAVDDLCVWLEGVSPRRIT
jgi:hypothetical protein